nr:MAG TPA: hypothetical protein [Caudoviricetes sp.]
MLFHILYINLNYFSNSSYQPQIKNTLASP